MDQNKDSLIQNYREIGKSRNEYQRYIEEEKARVDASVIESTNAKVKQLRF